MSSSNTNSDKSAGVPRESASESSAKRQVPRIELLTSARGLAALWVLTHNDSAFRNALKIDQWTHLIANGYLAVDFFLVLSGFVLTYVHRDDFRSLTLRGYGRFLWLRLARIYPLYGLLLGVRVMIEVFKWSSGMTGNFLGPAPFQDSNSPTALLANLFMIQAWGFYDESTWVHSFWSVSAEWFAYLWFPLLMFGLSRAKTPSWSYAGFAIACAGLAIVCVSVLLGGIHYFSKLEFPVQWSLLRCIPEFLLGVLLAFELPRLLAMPMARWLNETIVFSAGLLVLVGVHFGWHDIVFVAASLVFILFAAKTALACESEFESLSDSSPTPGPFTQFLTSKWLLYLGEISYAVYLVHLIVQSTFRVAAFKIFGEYPPYIEAVFFVIRLLIILVAASLLYHWFERPARSRLRRLWDQRSGDLRGGVHKSA